MKKDKKKKKKPAGGTKSELNGTGESMADSVSSEGGGAEGVREISYGARPGGSLCQLDEGLR